MGGFLVNSSIFIIFVFTSKERYKQQYATQPKAINRIHHVANPLALRPKLYCNYLNYKIM